MYMRMHIDVCVCVCVYVYVCIKYINIIDRDMYIRPRRPDEIDICSSENARERFLRSSNFPLLFPRLIGLFRINNYPLLRIYLYFFPSISLRFSLYFSIRSNRRSLPIVTD